MRSYQIHLLRHGISEGNLKKQYIGTTDSPLAEKGKLDLLHLQEKGTYPPIDRCYTSPLTRCVETAKILYPKAELVPVSDFREISFGEWEGQTAQALRGIPLYNEWLQGNAAITPPQGEPAAVFMQRVCFAFEALVKQILREGITTVAVVTHGGVIMTLLSSYGLPRAKFYDWMTENGQGYSLRITPGLWMRGMVAEVYQTLPVFRDAEAQRDESVLPFAREAAKTLWGEDAKEDPSSPKTGG